MAAEPDLLGEAKAAEERLIDAEHAVEVARAEFHRAVRRLHLAGASLRDIAAMLGLSHQRVHQIVEGAGGGRRWRKGQDRAGKLRCCSFCGRPQQKVKKLIAGPGVFICDRCIPVATAVLDTGTPAAMAWGTISPVAEEVREQRCRFCGKRRDQATGIASAGDASVCAECLVLCNEIVAEGV